MRQPRLASIVILCGLASVGWDTHTNDADNWRALYGTDRSRFCPTKTYHPGMEKPDQISTHGGGNEHAEIADDALWTISPDLREQFGIGSWDAIDGHQFVDLNTSFMRQNHRNDGQAGDNADTVLEERDLGDLVRFAGLPDFNYTIYDWVNKSQVCPTLPPEAQYYDLCHAYLVWKGAALNSTHFGPLATKSYARFHRIASDIAGDAGYMGTTLKQGGNTGLVDGMPFHESFVKEAELAALIYEMVGQHFLQDRWSIGHMFNRWGGGGYEDAPKQAGGVHMSALLAMGMFTGIVHGSEAVFGFPEPASAPLSDQRFVGDDTALISTWKYADASNPPENGIGDYRYGDMLDNEFDGTRVCLHSADPIKSAIIEPPFKLDVDTQLKGLRQCGSESIRDVISSFWEHDGVFGVHDITLGEPDAGLMLGGADRLGSDPSAEGSDSYNLCQDMWLDNLTFYRSFVTVFGTENLLPWANVYYAAKGIKKAATDPSPDGAPSLAPTAIRVTVQIALMHRAVYRYVRNDDDQYNNTSSGEKKYGTEAARKGFRIRFGNEIYRPNRFFDVPAYFPPEDLDDLPDEPPMDAAEDRGRDKWAVHGFFNKGLGLYWCEDIYARLKKMRDDRTNQDPTLRPSEVATCAYLAERAYKRTDPAYAGTRTEIIGNYTPFDGPTRYGDTFEPFCAYFHGNMDETGATVVDVIREDYNGDKDEEFYYLHPGYVEVAGEQGEHGHSAKSLENWCERIPVVDFTNDDPAYPEKVGEVGRDRMNGFRWLELNGENLGRIQGTNAGGVNARPLGAADDAWEPIFDIFHGGTGAFTGGWSVDGNRLTPQIPGSLAGFPSNATGAMTPDAIKATEPAVYELSVVQPLNENWLHRSEGKATVGPYQFLVYPTVEEVPGAFTGTKKAYRATYPAWLRDQTEVLAWGVYTVDGNGVYTEVFPPGEQRSNEGHWTFSGGEATFNPDPDIVGVLYETANPAGFGPPFDQSVVFVFAFH